MCMRGFLEDERSHRIFARKAEERYKAYRAILDRRMDAAKWTSKNHPPYVLQIIETMTAGLLDPNPKWKLKALPRLRWDNDAQAMMDGVKANETLLNYQLDCDKFVEKQRPFALQALITGLTVAKTYWRYEEGIQYSQVVEPTVLYDEEGNILHLGEKMVQKADRGIMYDEPTMDVVDVRDFIWHEAAPSLDRAVRVHHRCWFTVTELKDMVAAKRFNKCSRPDDITDSMAHQGDMSSFDNRERDLFDTSRQKDMCEVIEHWIDHGRRRVTIANRTLLLDDRPNPFRHGQYPFVVATAMPDLFRIPGISDVELINELQEMMWTLQNQRLDAVQLLNNPVVMFRDDFDDPDSFDFFPGARNLVADPTQVTLWTPPVLENRSIEHEQMLKDDLQSIPGASPALLGQLSGGSMTATEASLSSTLAMRRLQNKKMQFALSYARVGEHWIELNQQFITEERLVPLIGADGAQAFHAISPAVIQGKYHIKVDQLDESLIRQERTAEAASRMQMAVQMAPVLAALAQGGTAKMINMDSFVEDWLKSYDIVDTGRYFTAKPPPQAPSAAPQQGGQPQQAGVSATQATDMNAPSNAFSQAPVMAQQRQMAMQGAASNAPLGPPGG